MYIIPQPTGLRYSFVDSEIADVDDYVAHVVDVESELRPFEERIFCLEGDGMYDYYFSAVRDYRAIHAAMPHLVALGQEGDGGAMGSSQGNCIYTFTSLFFCCKKSYLE